MVPQSPVAGRAVFLQETQSLARRVDGLDERLWARTSGRGPRRMLMPTGSSSVSDGCKRRNVPRSEASKQRNREIEQQAAPSFLFVTSCGWSFAASVWVCQVQAMEQQNRLAAAAAEEFLHDVNASHDRSPRFAGIVPENHKPTNHKPSGYHPASRN